MKSQYRRHIFLSYSRHNSQIVSYIADRLRALDYSVWTDINAIIGGAIWHSELEKAIAECGLVIVALSEEAKASDWVQREILFAQHLGKSILPLLVGPVRSFPLSLINIQPIDVTRDFENGFQQLLLLLSSLNFNIGKDILESVSNDFSSLPYLGQSMVSLRQKLIESYEDNSDLMYDSSS